MKRFAICIIVFLSGIVLNAAQSPIYEDVRIQRRDSVLALITGARHDEAAMLHRSIFDFGARPDGKKDCKPAFDKAMKQALKSKGGMHLTVPAGEYLICGPIQLVSNLCLDLQEGATIRFSSDPKYYLPIVKTSWEGTFCQNYSPFIYGYKLHDVSIIGKGRIDGDASETFAQWRSEQGPGQKLSRAQNHGDVPVEDRNFGEGHHLRPHLLQLFGCEGVTLSDFFMTNAPFWCVHLLQCENVICRGLSYDAKLVNNDGIDPEMSRNILIEGIDFNNGDDNVAIKAGRDNDGWKGSPSENIVIRNCRFKGLHAVVLGSELSAGIRNVFVENCSYGGYCKRGLYVKTNPNRGGFVKDIYFYDCDFDEVEDLVYITSKYAGEGEGDTHFTSVGDIHVKNVHANKARAAAIVLQGTEELPLHDITFENVVVEQCAVGFSSNCTLDIVLRNCHLGGMVTGAPSQVSAKDKLFAQ